MRLLRGLEGGSVLVATCFLSAARALLLALAAVHAALLALFHRILPRGPAT